MLNDIITGIAKALGAIFGDECKVYENDVNQGLTEPCFFIAALKPERQPLLGDRAIWRNPFAIYYFPKDGGANAELYTVAEHLMYGLRSIALPNGDLVRGTKMNYEVVDGVLNFFVNYDLIIYKVEPSDAMDEISQDVTVKG